MMFIILAFVIALLFAMNMGASGSAASMGVAYGSGAIKKRTTALLLCGIGIFLGAAFGGSLVAETIGKGIIHEGIIDVRVALIILTAATSCLFIANLFGIPLSTSEVTVGAIVGVGIAYNHIIYSKLFIILLCWILIPLLAFIITFFLGKIVLKIEARYPLINQKKWLAKLLIITGLLEAISAGMNNVGNAIGPLAGAGLLSIQSGTLLGGVFIALGAIFLGGKVIETNGKKLTRLTLFQGNIVSSTGAILVITASLFGIPIPITQVTTSSILGVGAAKTGNTSIFEQSLVKRILKVWVFSPLFSLVISFGLIKVFIDIDVYTILAVVSVLLMTILFVKLIRSPSIKVKVPSEIQSFRKVE